MEIQKGRVVGMHYTLRNEEGEIIAEAIGDKKAIILSHHGQLIAGATIEEACVLAMLIERAAKMQLLAMAAGEIKLIPENLAREAPQVAFLLLFGN